MMMHHDPGIIIPSNVPCVASTQQAVLLHLEPTFPGVHGYVSLAGHVVIIC